ncbi:hypothetical protein HHK36_013156 [Tetracentron sinense]|uniref:Uncharacterized protein n=1 Tax=Tetracentron sinense TaxID=13715 RepID=A0A834Z605_TETSI|nr:hypothetical protein HHK36_013156 [Tetracentron sinense]
MYCHHNTDYNLSYQKGCAMNDYIEAVREVACEILELMAEAFILSRPMVDKSFSFLNNYVQQSLEKGDRPYIPENERSGMLNINNFRSQYQHEASTHALRFEAYELPQPSVASRIPSVPVPLASSTELMPVSEPIYPKEIHQVASLPSVSDTRLVELKLQLEGVQKKWGRPTYSSPAPSTSSSTTQKTVNEIFKIGMPKASEFWKMPRQAIYLENNDFHRGNVEDCLRHGGFWVSGKQICTLLGMIGGCREVNKERKEGSWRNRCFVGMAACMIIGLETGLLSGECHAFTEDSQIITVAEGNKLVRWSDKRMCPPWQMNSLEIIVPENLPRPSAHRKLV